MDQDDQTLRSRHTKPKPYPSIQCLESGRAQHHDPTLELNLRRPSYDYDSRACRYDTTHDYDPKAYRYDYKDQAYSFYDYEDQAYSSYDYVTQTNSSYDYVNQAKRATRNFRSEAPTFDGDLGPKGYVNWEREIDQFFEGCNMIEEKKCRLIKLKLVR